MKGRPLKYGEPTRNVNVNFPVGFIEILTKNAHRQGLGISEYLVRLLEYTPEDTLPASGKKDEIHTT